MKLIIAGGRDFDDKVLAVNSFMGLIAEVNYGVNHTVVPPDTITEQNNDTKSIVVRENPFTEIVISHTKGVESTPYSRIGDCHVGEFLANFYRIPVKRFISDWGTLGIGVDIKSLECVSNVEMVEYAVSDYNDSNRHSLSQKGLLEKVALLAFWDKKSKGTEHMIKIAKQKGLIVKIVYY